MNPTDDASIQAYVAAFERAAARRNLKEAHDLAADVRQHVEEARAAGKTWGEIRAKFGPPDSLARAYAAELLFGDEAPDVRAAPGRKPNVWALFGLATGGGLLTLIVASTLGSIAFAFGLSAALMLAVGLPIALGAPIPPWVHMEGAPWIAVALSPVLGATAWVAYKGLVAYLRWFANSLRSALPGRG